MPADESPRTGGESDRQHAPKRYRTARCSSPAIDTKLMIEPSPFVVISGAVCRLPDTKPGTSPRRVTLGNDDDVGAAGWERLGNAELRPEASQCRR
jgi:hypothetical protein